MNDTTGITATAQARLLGPSEFRSSAGTISFLNDKRYQLLAYLACKGDWVRRDELAYLFWSDTDNETARHSLRQLLQRVKALLLPEHLTIERERVRWSVPSDVGRFREALSEHRYHEALDLYGGPFLQGLESEETNEFNTWLEGERETLHARWREVILTHAEKAESSKAVSWLRRLLEHDPLDEEALQHYMTLLAQAGQTSGALGVYKTFAKTLEREMSLEPTSPTKELYRLIQSGDFEQRQVVAPATPRKSKPALLTPTSPLIGRDLELTDLTNLLLEPTSRLVTLLGPPGVGKTRLALQLAQQDNLGAFKNGIHVIFLETLTQIDLLPSRIAEALGLEQGKETSLKQVQLFIGNRDLLLALDNFEQLSEGATLLAALLHACPNLKLLVTSRERLKLEEEQVFLLSGLSLAQSNTTFEEAEHYDAVNLFVQRAKRVKPNFELTPENVASVIKICQRVEGLPLGVELAAAWVRAMSCEDIARDLETNLELLTSSSRNTLERHESIRAAFDSSWKLLTPKEQTALCQLSVFEGGFTREAALSVAEVSLMTLASLIDKSLLRSSAERFEQHPLVKRYGLEKLMETEHEAQLRAKHSSYYLARIHVLTDELKTMKRKEAAQQAERELPNLRVAWLYLVGSQDTKRLQENLMPLFIFYQRLRHYDGGCQFFKMTYALLSPQQPPELFAAVRAKEAALQAHAGMFAEAKAPLHESLALSHDPLEQAFIYRTLALQVDYWLGDVEAAKTNARRALGLSRRCQDGYGVATSIHALAIIAWLEGDAETCRTYNEEAERLFAHIGHEVMRLRVITSLGHLDLYQGNYRKTQQRLQDILAASETLADEHNLANIHSGLGIASFELGQLEKATAHLQQGLAYLEDIRDEPLLAELNFYLGQVELKKENAQKALAFFKASLREATRGQAKNEMLLAIVGFADYFALQGEAKALELYRFVFHHPTLSPSHKIWIGRRLGRLGVEVEKLEQSGVEELELQELAEGLLKEDYPSLRLGHPSQ
jgi:predicted ATPase/DNA-binding SARP family transcriptional activator